MQPPRPGSLHTTRPASLARMAALALAVLPGLAAASPAFASGSALAPGSSVAAAAGPAVERVALASPAGLRLSGTITGGSGPVAGAVVTACPTPTPATSVPVACKGGITTAAGSWAITGLAPGRYVVRVAPPATAGTSAAAGYVGASGYVAARSTARAVEVATDRSGLDLSLPAGRVIAGTVTTADGRPVRDAFVEACAADAPPGVACTGTYSAADGVFAVGGLGQGAYTVGAQAPTGSGLASGYLANGGIAAAASAARRIEAGSTGVAITLPRGRSVRGAVSLEKSGPAANGQVLVQACADAACVYGPAGWTDEDGRFTIPGLGSGTWTLAYALPSTTTHAGGYRGDGGYAPSLATAARITVAGSDVNGLDVTLPLAAARLEGTVTGAGAPLRGGVVVACAAGGTCFWTRTAQRDGAFALALPSAGPWTVGIRAPGTYTVGLPLAWTAGMVVPVDPVAMDGYLGAGGFTPAAANAASVVVGAPDRARPVVTVRAPKPNATKVATSTRVVVRFSEPVTGVTARSVVLRDAATRKPVPATVTYDAASRTATLSPAASLAKGRRYQVALTATIADYAGNRLAPTTWTFTTKR